MYFILEFTKNLNIIKLIVFRVKCAKSMFAFVWVARNRNESAVFPSVAKPKNRGHMQFSFLFFVVVNWEMSWTHNYLSDFHLLHDTWICVFLFVLSQFLRFVHCTDGEYVLLLFFLFMWRYRALRLLWKFPHTFVLYYISITIVDLLHEATTKQLTLYGGRSLVCKFSHTCVRYECSWIILHYIYMYTLDTARYEVHIHSLLLLIIIISPFAIFCVINFFFVVDNCRAYIYIWICTMTATTLFAATKLE